MKFSFFYVWLLLSLYLPTKSFSQAFELGVGAGYSVYNGDIDVSVFNAIPQLRPAGAVFAKLHVARWLAFRGQVAVGSLYGNEKRFPASPWREERGMSFTASLFEGAALVEITPFAVGRFRLTGFGGVATARFKAKTDFNQPSRIITAEMVTADVAANTKTVTVSLPIGGALQYWMDNGWVIGSELGGRKTFSDFFDGISAAGGPKSKDYYFFGFLTVSKVFGGRAIRTSGRRGNPSVDCPKF